MLLSLGRVNRILEPLEPLSHPLKTITGFALRLPEELFVLVSISKLISISKEKGRKTLIRNEEDINLAENHRIRATSGSYLGQDDESTLAGS